MVTELITLFIPGAGPPPQTIARVFWTGVVMVRLLHGILEQILAHYSGYNGIIFHASAEKGKGRAEGGRP
jgi:hypothetical protein